MKVGQFLLNEKTKVSLNLINLIMLVGFAITASFTFATWKAEFELIQQSEIQRLTVEIAERKQADKELKEDLKEAMNVFNEAKTDLVEIKTDLKWIIANMDKKE